VRRHLRARARTCRAAEIALIVQIARRAGCPLIRPARSATRHELGVCWQGPHESTRPVFGERSMETLQRTATAAPMAAVSLAGAWIPDPVSAQTPAQMEYERQQREYRLSMERQQQEQLRMQQLQQDNARRQQDDLRIVADDERGALDERGGAGRTRGGSRCAFARRTRCAMASATLASDGPGPI
jgi:hypothetical protein